MHHNSSGRKSLARSAASSGIARRTPTAVAIQKPAVSLPRLDCFGASTLAMTPGFALFQAHSNGKRYAGAAGNATAPKTGCSRFSGLARDRSRASPTDCSVESARQRASSRSRRRSGRWRQARIASRSAGDGSAGRVSAKSYSGKYRLAPWPRFSGNSPFWCDRFRQPEWGLRRIRDLKGRWHPLRSRGRGAPHRAG